MNMIIKTENGDLILTEIKNINGSLDNDEKFKKQFLRHIKESRFDFYKKEIYGFVTQGKWGDAFKLDFVGVDEEDRHQTLLKMFEEDKERANKFKARLSIFLIK